MAAPDVPEARLPPNAGRLVLSTSGTGKDKGVCAQFSIKAWNTEDGDWTEFAKPLLHRLIEHSNRRNGVDAVSQTMHNDTIVLTVRNWADPALNALRQTQITRMHRLTGDASTRELIQWFRTSEGLNVINDAFYTEEPVREALVYLACAFVTDESVADEDDMAFILEQLKTGEAPLEESKMRAARILSHAAYRGGQFEDQKKYHPDLSALYAELERRFDDHSTKATAIRNAFTYPGSTLVTPVDASAASGSSDGETKVSDAETGVTFESLNKALNDNLGGDNTTVVDVLIDRCISLKKAWHDALEYADEHSSVEKALTDMLHSHKDVVTRAGSEPNVNITPSFITQCMAALESTDPAGVENITSSIQNSMPSGLNALRLENAMSKAKEMGNGFLTFVANVGKDAYERYKSPENQQAVVDAARVARQAASDGAGDEKEPKLHLEFNSDTNTLIRVPSPPPAAPVAEEETAADEESKGGEGERNIATEMDDMLKKYIAPRNDKDMDFCKIAGVQYTTATGNTAKHRLNIKIGSTVCKNANVIQFSRGDTTAGFFERKGPTNIVIGVPGNKKKKKKNGRGKLSGTTKPDWVVWLNDNGNVYLRVKEDPWGGVSETDIRDALKASVDDRNDAGIILLSRDDYP